MTDAEQALLSQIALGIFSVDHEGRVWRHYRQSNGSALEVRPLLRIAPPIPAEIEVTSGYLRIQFTHKTERLQTYAHRIVWMVHNHQPIPGSMEINHKDGRKSNNHPANLELVTKSENASHALHQLGYHAKRNYPGAKLTLQQVAEIRTLYDGRTLAQTEIARMYWVSVKTVRDIGRRKTYAILRD
jgi:DNA-binding CsgD family transcriptional regulator